MSFIYDVLKKAEKEGKIAGLKIPPEPQGSQLQKIPKQPVANDLPKEIAEDFSKLQEKIEFADLNEHSKVLSVTSSISGEGATTVAAYLAMMYAREVDGFQPPNPHIPAQATKRSPDARENILLIDGNIRNPSLHRIFGLNREMGLTEIVEENLGFELAIKKANGGNLKIITSGRQAVNPTELIKSERLRNLIHFAREKFGNVIIDVAPVLLHADILAYNSVVDGTILVVRAGRTRYEVVQEAKAILEKGKTNILGVVLNRRGFEIPEALYRRL